MYHDTRGNQRVLNVETRETHLHVPGAYRDDAAFVQGDSEYLLTGGCRQPILIYEMDPLRAAEQLLIPELGCTINDSKFCNGCPLVFVRGESGAAWIIDALRKKTILAIGSVDHDSIITFASDGMRLSVTEPHGVVKTWDLQTGNVSRTELKEVTFPPGCSISAILIGEYIGYVSNMMLLRVFSLRNGEEISLDTTQPIGYTDCGQVSPNEEFVIFPCDPQLEDNASNTSSLWRVKAE